MPVSSLTITSSKVTVALSSLVMVTVAVSVMVISPEATVPADNPLIEMLNVSSASTLISAPGVMVKVCTSPAVPVNVNVCPDTAI